MLQISVSVITFQSKERIWYFDLKFTVGEWDICTKAQNAQFIFLHNLLPLRILLTPRIPPPLPPLPTPLLPPQ